MARVVLVRDGEIKWFSRWIEIFRLSEMRCGLMYGGYGPTGAAWWARHVSLLLPHSLLPPSRIPNQQTTPVANCSPIHPEPLNTSRTGSPRRCTPEKTKFGENFNQRGNLWKIETGWLVKIDLADFIAWELSGIGERYYFNDIKYVILLFEEISIP